MQYITLKNVKDALCKLKDKPMSRESLEWYVLLSKAKKCLEQENHHELTNEEAEKWVKCMTPPARWTMEQTNSIMQQKGYYHNPCVFWAVMNALASDYGKTLAKYSADKPEVWAELTHDWLNDADAQDGKAAAYYREIVRH